MSTSGFMGSSDDNARSQNDDLYPDLDPGFYVVKYRGGDTTVAFKDNSSCPEYRWQIVGSDDLYSDSDIQVVSEVDMDATP